MKISTRLKNLSSPAIQQGRKPIPAPTGSHWRTDSAAVRRILRGPHFQTKLSIGAPDDVHEQEADRVADEILKTSQTFQPMVQRQEDPDSPSESLLSPNQTPPGREPTPNEKTDWGVTDYSFPKLTEFRILREPTYGYNCFAWAVGVESRSITTSTIMGLNYSMNLEGWTQYLKEKHGFVRHADGADAGADLVLFGESEHMVWHAARKAEQPFGHMTFSSKLGERSKTPVILHDLLDLEGEAYGNALRSFWRASDSKEQAEGDQIQQIRPERDGQLRRQPVAEEEEEMLQSKQADSHTTPVTPHLAAEIAAMQGGGQPLPASERAFFEPCFGHDFSQVRVYRDQPAAEAAKAVNARAFTLGKDVFFGSGQFVPASLDGKRLLAHELAHVVQQSAGNKIVGELQRSPVFPDGSCGGKKVELKITEYVEIALELVKNALLRLQNPQAVAGPLRRLLYIEPTDTIYLSKLKENLTKLQKKLEEPVNSYCQTRSFGKYSSRAFVSLDEQTGRVNPDAGITYNRNIFRLTGFTTRRQIINTVLHEYAHLFQVGHGSPDPNAPIENEDSTKVRGLTKEKAINNAESHMRFIRAVS